MTDGKKGRGGARPGAGRRAKFQTAMGRYDVMLDQHTVTVCLKLGKGNLSEGIRLAAEKVELAASS